MRLSSQAIAMLDEYAERHLPAPERQQVVRISGPNFTATLTLQDGMVIDAPQMLSWMLSQSEIHLLRRCRREGWTWEPYGALLTPPSA